VSVMEVFGSDPYLFNMALRAVGNLTRCDENIVSVMAYGAAQSIGSGMAQHPRNLEVLSVAADVIGNLASVDEESVDPRKAARILEKGMQARETAVQQIRSGFGGGGRDAPGAGLQPGVVGQRQDPAAVLQDLVDAGSGEGVDSLSAGLTAGTVHL